ncbi:MAG: acetolactate synthase large subunit [Rubrivivax sp.]|nr:acetolactate synthase large subunit [Rubrivivax sp.]
MTAPNPPARTGADLLCETLLAHGVDHCFANPGTSEMHFVAALDRQPRMRCLLGLSEGVVTGAADGYARMAGRPACTLLHTGPGLANGLANLHNAKRAASPMVNVVGDHATYHLEHDAPLTSDIESLARPMSHWVARSPSADGLGEVAAAAVREARTPPGRIATLILAADHSWGATTAGVPAAAPLPRALPPDAAALLQAAAALKRGAGTVLLLAGDTLRAEGLALAARIASATGARLLAPQANARVERGLGRVMIDRVPYVVDKALAMLKETTSIVLVGAKAPVGFFAYPGKPGSMLPPGCEVITATRPGQDGLVALRELAERVGAVGAAAEAAARPMFAARRDLPLPAGALTAAAVAQAVVALLPEQAIVCDESVSSGREFFPMSWHAAPHDYLQITGGAIGIGIPLATGAAVAAPGRKVVTLQADGSAMYTLQGLWTQARERLDVVTVIFSNRRYAILHGEYVQTGAGVPGANARRLFDIEDPALDWVALARGMGVAAERAETAERFNAVLAAALKQGGPFLIEAVI